MMLPWIGIGLLFVLLALIPWRWESVGGTLLIAAGLLAGVAYAILWWRAPLDLGTRLLTTFVFGAPPIAAGLLFLTHRQASARN
jgi:hypothetical protein